MSRVLPSLLSHLYLRLIRAGKVVRKIESSRRKAARLNWVADLMTMDQSGRIELETFSKIL
jgi:hypothetical protein